MSEPNLEEVLEDYAAATSSGNNLKILRLLTEKYPQFAADLADFAAARAVVKFAPDEELSADEEKRFRESGLKNLREILGANDSITAPQNALQSLTDTAKEKGLSRKSFAVALGLSVSLVMYLEKRRLAFASIPKNLLRKISEVLETSEDLIASYLNQPPDLSTGASFKTNTRPEDLQPKTFVEAVREDQKLSIEDKRKLLELN